MLGSQMFYKTVAWLLKRYHHCCINRIHIWHGNDTTPVGHLEETMPPERLGINDKISGLSQTPLTHRHLPRDQHSAGQVPNYTVLDDDDDDDDEFTATFANDIACIEDIPNDTPTPGEHYEHIIVAVHSIEGQLLRCLLIHESTEVRDAHAYVQQQLRLQLREPCIHRLVI
eukprot:2888455-Amphidinium_carterae.1